MKRQAKEEEQRVFSPHDRLTSIFLCEERERTRICREIQDSSGEEEGGRESRVAKRRIEIHVTWLSNSLSSRREELSFKRHVPLKLTSNWFWKDFENFREYLMKLIHQSLLLISDFERRHHLIIKETSVCDREWRSLCNFTRKKNDESSCVFNRPKTVCSVNLFYDNNDAADCIQTVTNIYTLIVIK